MTNLIDDMEKDAAEAAAAIAEFGDQTLTELGILALTLGDQIDHFEEERKVLSKRLDRLMRYAIPERLKVLGVDEYGFEHEGGKARIVLDLAVFASLNKAPDLDEAVAYLEANGLSGVVKTVVSVPFLEDQREEAEALAQMLEAAGIHPEIAKSIHASTLRAFIANKLKDDPSFDYEKVGATVFPQAKFTKKR